VSDGEGQTETWVWFHVMPVNDPIEFTAPAEWNVTVDIGTLFTIDLADLISDIDGDAPIITTDSSFITVNGTVLELLYNNSFTETSETVTVTVSDGPSEIMSTLLVNINMPADDDDDEEPTIGTLDVTGKEDKWIVEADGSEDQELWIVVEDEKGDMTSYKMTYSDGKYTADIPKGDAEEGLSFWISDEEDGEPVGDVRALPALNVVDDDPFPMWIIILIMVMIILAIVIVGLLITGKKKDDYYDEE
ncbi:MAG: hypothetical protein U9R75_06255, partial [Candidatus Thermoplasmatota archaeon]|nr:hypothetical protein [Candidatus Thermoplasmatota archaeon]